MSAENRGIRGPRAKLFLGSVGKSSLVGPRRRMISLLLAGLMAATTAVDVCQGWSSQQSERKACCARMDNHCATWSVDACCEKGEQRRTRDLARSVAQPAPDMTPGAIVAPLVLIERETDVLILLGRPRPHLLHEVFLI